ADGRVVRCPYAGPLRGALKFARSLAEAGLRRGDLVAIILPDADQYLTTLFGASMAGVLPASMSPPSTTTELARYFELTAATLRSAGARAVVTTKALAADFEGLPASCPTLSLLLARP